MSNKVLIGCSAPLVLGMLVLAVVVWAGVMGAANEGPPEPAARPAPQLAPAPPASNPDAAAEARREFEAQQEFEAGMPDPEPGPPVPSIAPESDLPPGAPPPADTSTLVSTGTCDGGSIALNVAEKRMLELHNSTRADFGLGSLCVDPEITEAARDHSADMLARNYFAHESPEGLQPWQRMERAGYEQCGDEGTVCSENAALGAGSRGQPGDRFRALMNSPGHRAAILLPDFQRVGVGALTGTYSKDGVTRDDAVMYTVNFAGQYPRPAGG